MCGCCMRSSPFNFAQRRVEAQDLLGALAESLPPGDRQETAGPAGAYAIAPAVVARADAILRSKDLRQRTDKIAAAHALHRTGVDERVDSRPAPGLACSRRPSLPASS